MSNFGLSCDVCNRENVGTTWVNGMKFCAKCYQETFGNQKKYVDMLHKETGELLVNLLAEKDKQIAELQYQLEASETQKRRHFEKVKILDKENKELKELLEEVQGQYGYECECNKQFVDCQQENDLLKQQLKSQPAEIVEKIRSKCCVEDKCKDGSFVLGINEKDLNTILKEYQK